MIVFIKVFTETGKKRKRGTVSIDSEVMRRVMGRLAKFFPSHIRAFVDLVRGKLARYSCCLAMPS